METSNDIRISYPGSGDFPPFTFVEAPKEKPLAPPLVLKPRLDIKRLKCCGIVEVSGLGDIPVLDKKKMSPQDVITVLACQWMVRNCAWVLFTEATRKVWIVDKVTDREVVQTEQPTYGKDLADFILEHKLGTIQVMGPQLNHNSGNRVTAYYWVPDCEAVKKWIKANAPEYVVYLWSLGRI
jgi:hypothetical protein